MDSEFSKFTDDATYFWIEMPCCRKGLHENGTRVYERAEKWQKNFAVGKCKVMLYFPR